MHFAQRGRPQKRPQDKIQAHWLCAVLGQELENPAHQAVAEENEGKCSHSWHPIEPSEGRDLAKNQEDRVCETDLDGESECRCLLEVIDDRLDHRNENGCIKSRGIPHQTCRQADASDRPDPPAEAPRHED